MWKNFFDRDNLECSVKTITLYAYTFWKYIRIYVCIIRIVIHTYNNVPILPNNGWTSNFSLSSVVLYNSYIYYTYLLWNGIARKTLVTLLKTLPYYLNIQGALPSICLPLFFSFST